MFRRAGPPNEGGEAHHPPWRQSSGGEEVDTGSTAALVTMEFELYDRKARKVVWTHFYTRSEPVQGKEITDVVSAFDRNLAQGLTEVVSGLGSYFSASLSGKS